MSRRKKRRGGSYNYGPVEIKSWLLPQVPVGIVIPQIDDTRPTGLSVPPASEPSSPPIIYLEREAKTDPSAGRLTLSGCSDKTLAASIPARQVKDLDLSGSSALTDAGLIAVASKLTHLKVLVLRGCIHITSKGVTAVARHASGLEELVLANCWAVSDEGLADAIPWVTKIQRLDLTNCSLVGSKTVLAIGAHLTALTHLDLWGCDGVYRLPDSFGDLRRLMFLDVRKTTLLTLPATMLGLRSLVYLDTRDTPSLELPNELTRHPEAPRAILEYLARSQKEGLRPLNEAKLILVGNESVGKTSLVNFLVYNIGCADTAKTSGVAITEGVVTGAQLGLPTGTDMRAAVKKWGPQEDAAKVVVTKWMTGRAVTGGADLRLNVWDFGGQQVLYETHQFFLTARSLYLVTLEARRENENEQEANLIAWLRTIRTRTVESVPVIVVINKSEPPHDLRLDERRLIEKYPNIRGFIRTSCQDLKQSEYGGRGIEELRQKIVEVIRDELPHVRDRFPLSYFNVKAELGRTARESSILNTDAYRNTCVHEGVTDREEQENLLALLDRIGVVVKYDDTTLLDPNWLTTAVYRILTHPSLATTGGGFGAADVRFLLLGLDPAVYPPDRHPFIVRMMEKFGLSFRIPADDERYLVPNRLQVERPLLPGWEDPYKLAFQYSYPDTPPRGLLPRFIVAAHKFLTIPRVAWLTGVLLSIEGCKVLAEVDFHARRVTVAVDGPESKRQDALAVVRYLFGCVHDLNRFLPGKDVTAEVPAPVADCPDAAFDYETLQTYERNRVDEILYKGVNTVFSVSKLLQRVGPEPLRPGADGRRTVQKEVAGQVTEIQYYGTGDMVVNTTANTLQNDNRGGVQVGVALGDHALAQAEYVLMNHRQRLSPAATPVDEMKAVVNLARNQLAAEGRDPVDTEEASGTIDRIMQELSQPNPNKGRVGRWLNAVEGVSPVVGHILRGTKLVKDLLA